MSEEIKFKCIPVNQRFYSDSSNWGVFVFHTKDNIPEFQNVVPNPFSDEDTSGLKMSTLAGNMQQLYIGSEYEVIATLEYNEKYKSYQYKPKIITSVAPKTLEQQERFLNAIITEKQAKTLLSEYPNIVQDILDGKDNVELFRLKGIGETTYDRIKEKVIENYVISDVLILLQPLGVNYNTIKRLLMGEPNPALLKQKLIDDPYIMLNLRGFGWKSVDDLALKINPKLKVSEKRTYAFIKYILNERGNGSGHTWIYESELDNAIRDNIIECMDLYKGVVEREKETNIILYFNRGRVGLLSWFNMEKSIFEMLKEIDSYEPLKVEQEDIDKGIANAEKEQGFTLTDEQRNIVIKSLNNNVTIITGKAGSGKTSISRAILNIYKQANYSISCAALSAKAAQRIIEATNFPSSTIHRMLGYEPTGGFLHNRDNPLCSDVILLDECSMINAQIFHSVISAIKEGAKIIMCGDHGQLPPIGFGNIFGDLLLKTNDFNINKLNKVLRQAEDSGILNDANKIRVGEMPIDQPELKLTTGKLNDMTYMFRDNREGLRKIAINTYMKSIDEVGIDNLVIVTPRRENCVNSTIEINNIINDLYVKNKSKKMVYGTRTYYIGSKVMQTDNNYEKNVFNGETGYITNIEEYKKDKENIVEFEVDFVMGETHKIVRYSKKELDQLELAYAITCHKSQGSGYHTVISIIDNTHYSLLDGCMLYTALTRAKKRCLLLAEPSAFKQCVYNNKSKERQTWLKEL